MMANSDDLIERGKRKLARMRQADRELNKTLRHVGYDVPRIKLPGSDLKQRGRGVAGRYPQRKKLG